MTGHQRLFITSPRSMHTVRRITTHAAQTARLNNRVIIVSGGGAGIGEGCVLAATREGAKVVIADIDEACHATRPVPSLALRQVKGKALATHTGALFVPCDVRCDSSVEALIEQTMMHFGRIDGLVNNAGTHNGMGLDICTTDDFRDLIDLNLTSQVTCQLFIIPCLTLHRQFRLAKYCAPHMQASDDLGGTAPSASIVNMASGVGLVGQMNSVAYASSKAGSLGLMRTLAVELGKGAGKTAEPAGHRPVRVNAICPGMILYM